MTKSKKEEFFPPCEAPIHCDECDGVGRTKDHFTPKCIAKLWGWSGKQIGAEENLQYLSEPCHIAKDISTPARYELAKEQMDGAYIAFGEHQMVDDPEKYREHLRKIKLEPKEIRRVALRKYKRGKHHKTKFKAL
jgi:hypothetical protein